MSDYTVDDIDRTWARYRYQQWDWTKYPVRNIPITKHTSYEKPKFDHNVAMQPVSIIQVSLERGYLDGIPAARLVATIPGTGIEKVVEELIFRERSPR